MNCVICDKELKSALPPDLEDKNSGQPYGGGEIVLKFCFGSTKFDNCPGMTYFDGFICDDCAEPLTKKMKIKMVGMHGEPWSEEIQEETNKKFAERYANSKS